MIGEDGKPLEPVALRLTRLKAPLTDIKLLAPLRRTSDSPRTITCSEVENFAFVHIGVRLAPTDAIRTFDHATEKIAAWATVHDDKAPLVSCGRAIGSFCIWPPARERLVTFA